MPISVSPTKNFLKKPKPPPLLRLNSDPKILPSTEESRIQEAFSVVLEDEFHRHAVPVASVIDLAVRVDEAAEARHTLLRG